MATAEALPDRCGARTRSAPGYCERWPMEGQARCHAHGGKAPRALAAAQARRERAVAEQAVTDFALPRSISPRQALAEELARSAGVVAYLDSVVQGLDQDGLKQDAPGEGGVIWERPSVWVQMHLEQRKHYLAVAERAARAGIEERQLALVEAHAQVFVQALRGVFADLGLTAEQQALTPGLVRRHLTAVASGPVDAAVTPPPASGGAGAPAGGGGRR